MKKKILMLVALLASVVSTYADDMFTVTSAGIPKGAQGTIAIGLPSTNNNTYAAFQITLTLPEGLTLESAAKGDLLSTHTISASGTTNVTISAAATPTADFTGTSGTLCVLTVSAAANATDGNLTILAGGGNTLLTYYDATNDVLGTAETHAVTVTDGIVLDETSTVLPAATTTAANVTMNRTLNRGVWNTLCLPFALTKELADAAFGSDAQICFMGNVTTSGTTISVEFTKDDLSEPFPANYPFIVKPSTNKTVLTFNGVTLTPNETEALVEVGGRTKTGKFIGTLKAGTTIPADYIFLGTDNKFYYSTGNNTIKGFRGYFWLKDFSSTSGARQVTLFVDDVPTSISVLKYDSERQGAVEGTYNLKGQRIDTPATNGVYIKDGKKVVIK